MLRRVETNIDRDPKDRKRMAALAYGATRGRQAASNYVVQETLALGNAALVSVAVMPCSTLVSIH